jgi:leukotriene-A4 hydrolase
MLFGKTRFPEKYEGWGRLNFIMNVMDQHSYARPDRARVEHVDLDLAVGFDTRTIQGTAAVQFKRLAGDDLILDTRGLEIHAVENAPSWELGPADPIFGAPLTIRLANADPVVIHYSTSPGASGLQWLDPAQTAGKQQPFLFTQSQAIHARSWIPIQDTPGVRVTYTARVRTPQGVRAVMSAEERPDGSFELKHPIPSYLIALAVGDLARRNIGPRSAIYAEPAMVDAAAREFEDTEAMIAAVEGLYGPYRWGRYDLLVLPPSFPFGGMENPLLTFATPTVIAGDKSLVSLVAHELAHSWSGNLVTNATWSDFWLNEGFTVYVERRIIEKLYGPERADMEAVLGRRELDRDMERLPDSDRILHIDLGGRDPDDGVTLVPYEKGALLLLTIEQAVGRARFDAFLREYFDHFAFQSITTAQFLEYVRRVLPNAVPLDEWIFQPGIPAGAHEPQSDAFDRIGAEWPKDTSRWSTHEWLHFLRSRENPDLAKLDREFRLTQSGNSEILAQWLQMAVSARYEAAMPKLEEFLVSVGRRKFLKPLYTELMKTPEGRERALRIYAKARPGYHPIAQNTIDAIVR